MTTSASPDFVLGMAVEFRPSPRKMGGSAGHAEAHIGHAVKPENVKDGDGGSRAVCGEMATVSDPTRTYHPRGGLAYGDCFTCGQHVAAAR